MDDIIAIIIILIGFGIKIIGSMRKGAQERERSSTGDWQEWNEFPVDPPEEVYVPPADGYTQTVAQLQAQKDAALLEAQRRYEAMAEQAMAVNQASRADETSEIYNTVSDPETENSGPGDAADWAELIRNNRTEAVIIAEILAKPAALR